MSSGRTILRNFAALSGAQMISMAAGLISTVVLARALGPETYGILGFGVAFISYFSIFVNMGVDTYAMREVARDRGTISDTVGTVLPLRAGLALFLFGLLYLVTTNLEQSDRVKTVLLIQGAGLFATAISVDFVFQGVQRMGVIGLRQALASIASVIAVVALVRAPADLFAAAAIPIIVNLVSGAALIAVLVYVWGIPRLLVVPRQWWAYLTNSFPVAITILMTTVIINMDIVILGFLRSEQEVGLYVAASRVLIVALVFGNMVHNAFFPALVTVRDNVETAKQMAKDHAKAVMFVGAPIGAFGIAFAEPIVTLLFGPEYLGSAFVLILLMANLLIVHVTIAHGTPLLAWKCDKAYAWIVAVGATGNILLNLLLIPPYGITGAAVATIISQSFILLGLTTVMFVQFRIHTWPILAKSLIATVTTIGPVWYSVSQIGMEPVASLLFGGVVFSLAYLMVGHWIGAFDFRIVVSFLGGKLGQAAHPTRK